MHIDWKNFNRKNFLISLVAFIIVIILKTMGMTATMNFIYIKRDMIEFLMKVIIACMLLPRVIQIMRIYGMKGFFSKDSEFLGRIGETALKGILIFYLIYTGFILFDLTLIGKFSEDLSEEGQLMILLFGGYLFANAGFLLDPLIKEIYFISDKEQFAQIESDMKN